jgi:MoxR-like ATPase
MGLIGPSFRFVQGRERRLSQPTGLPEEVSVKLSDRDAQETAARMERVLYELKKVIVGQENLLQRLLIALMVEGHVLVEGAPGLAKTLTLRSLAQVLDVSFKRIQFTPDLLPSDLIGTRVYNPLRGEFSTEQGPIFAHFILADEINRAPAKVQSALLEAMQERQVTIGRETFRLQAPFLVMATQNPLESEGTYPLPEAQLDRFLFKILVDYPSATEELAIVERMSGATPVALETLLSADWLAQVRAQAAAVYLDPKLIHYLIALVQATRAPERKAIAHGASPRGSLALAQASRALALLHGRTYVTPEDVLVLAHDCLRHRLILSYEGLAQGLSADQILKDILAQLPPPNVIAPKATHSGQASV